MELDVNSRFRVLDAPIVAPGKCAVCGSSSTEDRKYVDFGFQLDWFGAIYLCTICLTEAALSIDLVNRVAYESLVLSWKHEAEFANLKAKEFEEQHDAARVLLRHCNCTNPYSGLDVTDSISVAPEIPDANIEAPGDNDESGSVEGSGDISESPSDESSEPPKSRSRKRTDPGNE